MYRQIANGRGEEMNFSRPEYNIPLNYRGNAFTAEEIPAAVNEDGESTEEEYVADLPVSANTAEEKDEMKEILPPKHQKRSRLKTMLSDLQNDDILIIGLILLFLLNDKDDCDESSNIIPTLLVLLLINL